MYIMFSWKKWVEGILWGGQSWHFSSSGSIGGFEYLFLVVFCVVELPNLCKRHWNYCESKQLCVCMIVLSIGTYLSIDYHIILNHYWFLSPMILPSDSESLLLASDLTSTTILVSVSSIMVFRTFEHQYYSILIEYSVELRQSLNSNM